MANEAVASGGAAGGGGADEVGPASGLSSPNSRMKFLCSYGGKILPRTTDGHLKYVGGDTRVIAVPRDISFSELMKKVRSEFEGDMVLKYQLMPDELDVLVSVRNDEDMKHMLDEYDRLESEGTAKLRVFLFPSDPIIIENQNASVDPHTIEQRYIDAVNNTVRTFASYRSSPINASSPNLSACSSPKGNSPDKYHSSSLIVDGLLHEPNLINNHHNTRPSMARVHSSPSLYNLGTSYHQTNNNHSSNHHFYQQQQQQQQQPQQHHHQYYQQHQQHNSYGYPPPSRPPHDPHLLTATVSFGRMDTGRAPVGGILPNQYYSNVQSMGNSNVHNIWSSNGHNMGSGNSTRRYDHSIWM